MLGQLIPVGKGDPIELRSEKLLIGSHRLCDIVIHSQHVAPVHCQLALRDFWWYIRNLAAIGETKVNGLPVVEQRLVAGDILWLGSHRYEIQYDTEELTNHGLQQPSTE